MQSLLTIDKLKKILKDEPVYECWLPKHRQKRLIKSGFIVEQIGDEKWDNDYKCTVRLPGIEEIRKKYREERTMIHESKE